MLLHGLILQVLQGVPSCWALISSSPTANITVLKDLDFWRSWITSGFTLLPNFIQAKGEWIRRLTYSNKPSLLPRRTSYGRPCSIIWTPWMCWFQISVLCAMMQGHIFWWTGLLSIIFGNPDRSSLDFPFMSTWQKNRRTLNMALAAVKVPEKSTYTHTSIFLNFDRIKRGRWCRVWGCSYLPAYFQS